MSNVHFTITEIAEAIGKVEGIRELGPLQQRHRKIREFERQGMLMPVEGETRGKAKLFDATQAAKTALLSYMGELRLHLDEIGRLAAIIDPQETVGLKASDPRLENVVAGSLGDETWLLDILVYREADGRLEFSGRYRLDQDKPPYDVSLMGDAAKLRGRELREMRILPVTPLIRNVLHALHGGGA